MKKKPQYGGRAQSMPAGIIIGLAVSLVVSLLGAALLAWLIVSETVGEDAANWAASVILPLASAAGSAAAWSRIKENRLAVCGICCASLYCLLFLAALPFGGEFEGLGISALLILLGGGITFIPGILGSKSGAKKYKRKAFR